MGEKLYPEVDHMALGQRYCDHVMAMTADGLHDKSDIAGQLAWRDEQLAAKDREIAAHKVTISELAEQFDALRADRDIATGHLGELLAVIHRDGGQYHAEHGAAKAVEDALSKLSSLRCELYDLRGEYDETAALFGAWQQRAEQSESERDEARECVKRLSGALRAIGAYADEGASAKLAMTGNYAWFDEPGSVRIAREAIAATPEHLRQFAPTNKTACN